MVTVAVAGGTGSVGRTIVDALLLSGKHDVVVLSRKVRENGPRKDYLYNTDWRLGKPRHEFNLPSTRRRLQ